MTVFYHHTIWRPGRGHQLLASYRMLPHQIFLVGHSYGGWLATETLTSMPFWFEVKQLVTIDPISPVNCPPERFVNAYMSSQWSFKPARGCIEAPRDQSENYKEAAELSGTWHHYWQDRFGYLHSGPISQADYSTWLDMEAPFLLEFKSHRDIDTDDRIWHALSQRIQKDMRL